MIALMAQLQVTKVQLHHLLLWSTGNWVMNTNPIINITTVSSEIGVDDQTEVSAVLQLQVVLVN
jgi:hypothetical protein